MMNSEELTALNQLHTPEAIKQRIESAGQQSYLGDFVLGAVDGAVTTFAIVAGAAGAGLPNGVAIVLGLANVAADGFSMAASNYLKARADQHMVERYRHMEERHIDLVPDAEREEIRQIFAAKGFEGDVLEEIVRVITNDRQQWVDTMLTDEWGLQLDTSSPSRAALMTFVAFVSAGLLPLAPLFVAVWLAGTQVFLASVILTALTFFTIGIIRGKVANQPAVWSGLETLFIGGSAASLAYLVGVLLKNMAGVS